MSNSTIVCRATPEVGSKWLLITGVPGSWSVEDAFNNLQQAVEAVTATPFMFPNATDPALQSRKAPSRLAENFTFSTRDRESAVATYAEHPDDLPGLGTASHATILLPEGGGVENKWAVVHRVGMSGALVGTGLDGRFRSQLLTDRVLDYFVKQQWRSFQPQKVSERHEPVHQQAQRPAYARELLVRHGWSARAIAPHAFAPVRSGPVLPPEIEAKRLAKMPAGKAAARRLKHQEADARFKAEAAERARLRGEVA